METYTKTKYTYCKGGRTEVDILYCMHCDSCLEYDHDEHDNPLKCIERLKLEINDLRSDFKDLANRMDKLDRL
jgi:hypothetical protein